MDPPLDKIPEDDEWCVIFIICLTIQRIGRAAVRTHVSTSRSFCLQVGIFKTTVNNLQE
jgi:hypothetical protein